MKSRLIFKMTNNYSETMMPQSDISIEPRAWQIKFAESIEVLPVGVETIQIAEPRNVTAVLSALAPSIALARADLDTAGEFTVIWMPPGANTPATIERDVDDWMRDVGLERKEVGVRAEVRTVRVIWTASRAVIYAGEGDLHFALDAIVRFSVAQREALALEETMKSTWGTLEADVQLTHALTVRDLKMQKHVNQMTVVTTHMKMSWLRILRSLEQLNPPLPNPSKRIFAELASAAQLHDRLESLEHTMQFAVDHYEISNTRLIDMYLARIDRVNSIYGYGIIIILLLVQIWLMLLEADLL